jgi:hypothetical protein
MEVIMMTFLDTLDLTESAREGIVDLIFGELEPGEALSFDRYLSGLSEGELMRIVVRNLNLS